VSSGAVAAAAAADPWAWLDAQPAGGCGAAQVSGRATAASLQHHSASRRLFAAPDANNESARPEDPKQTLVHRRLQLQAQQLQAELALATQQLHSRHGFPHLQGAPGVTLAG
jgi:hypothetical protein